MARTHRLSTVGALIICLVGTQWSATLLASEEQSRSSAAPSAQSVVSRTTELPPPTLERSRFTLNEGVVIGHAESKSLAQRGFYRGRGRGDRHGALTAIVLGAVASIAGGAILIYANRPECGTTNHAASGCGYGTKVVGGAVLSAGIVGLLIGASMER